MNVCVFIIFAMTMLLKDSGPYVFYLNAGWLVGDHLLPRNFGL
jgi:hypothetical protein